MAGGHHIPRGGAEGKRKISRSRTGTESVTSQSARPTPSVRVGRAGTSRRFRLAMMTAIVVVFVVAIGAARREADARIHEQREELAALDQLDIRVRLVLRFRLRC